MISTKQASEMGEKLILYVIGIGAFITALVDIFNAISSYSIQLEQLFTLFIYAEIIGMVGAYTSSSRIPVTLPIIIAITALCRLIVMHGKDMEALVLLGESGSILLLSGAAYVMSLKGKLSLEKKDSFEKN
jgi:protein PsiE